jgi:hypothetical protein
MINVFERETLNILQLPRLESSNQGDLGGAAALRVIA